MGWNETKMTVLGRVCTEISSRTTTDGVPMTCFTVAANERRYDAETESWATTSTLFVRVKCFRRLAEGVAAALAKGDPVLVTGRVYTSRYEVDGQLRSEVEMEATGIGPDLTMCRVEVQRAEHAGAVAA